MSKVPKSGVTPSEFIPFSSHVHVNVVKTAGGEYVVCWNLQGYPFVGRDEWELEHRHATFNRLLQTLRAPDYTNVSFWVHDVRRRGKVMLKSEFGSKFNQVLSDRYYEQLSAGEMMRNELFFTLIYRPLVNGASKFSQSGTDAASIKEEELGNVTRILELAGSVEAVLQDYAPYKMGTYTAKNGIVFSEILEFYGYLLNHCDEPVPVLNAPIHGYLSTSQNIFNDKTGVHLIRSANGTNHFGAILNIKEFPENTYPGILNDLKYLQSEYVITQSFTPFGKPDALKLLERTKGRMISSQDKAASQIIELDAAMDGLSSGNFILGNYHFSLALYADSVEELNVNIPLARSVFSNAGFVSVREDIGNMAAFYAQLPCNWAYRTRTASISSLNFLGLSPLHNFSVGKRMNNPWGDPVTVLQSSNGQPYYFNFHATRANENSLGEMALANTLVIGKSGTGKTALINFLLSQVQKFKPNPTIFFFDKDHGAEIFVRASGGRYMSLESGKPTGFNPLQCDNTESNAMFLVSMIKLLAAKEKYSASEDVDVLRAVRSMLDAPKHLRTMTNLQSCIPNLGDDSIYSRLRKWTQSGYLGWVFDNPEDKVKLDNANIIGFDYTDLIDLPEVRVPVINYLIHRMEELIDGRPFIYVMDEFWKILDGEGGLKEFARNKLKTIRKQNGFGIFATQSPSDALKSDIAKSLVEQVATFVLLPNPNADEIDYVEGLKLSQAEYQELKKLDERSRCFLIKQGHSSVVCKLSLNAMPKELLVLSAGSDTVELMHRLVEQIPLEAGMTKEDAVFRSLDPNLWLDDFYDQSSKLSTRNTSK